MTSRTWLILNGSIVGLLFLGNACMPTFKTLDDVGIQACLSDESQIGTLNKTWKLGTIGNGKIQYSDRGDGWLLVDGDQLVPETSLEESADGGLVNGKVFQGVGIKSSTGGHWPQGRIPYSIPSNFSNPDRVHAAINHWNTKLAGVIEFYPRTNETDYVGFQDAEEGCFAPVGLYKGKGLHPVNLGAGCGSGNAAHELGHVTGLDHEQNRPDRDTYLTVNWSRIQSGFAQNFELSDENQSYGSYNFGSIMHYTLTAFSSDGSPTLSPKVGVPAGVTIGQRQSLSAGDIEAVALMYGKNVNVVAGNGNVGMPGGTTLSSTACGN